MQSMLGPASAAGPHANEQLVPAVHWQNCGDAQLPADAVDSH